MSFGFLNCFWHFKAAESVSFMQVKSIGILSMQISWKVMISCVITELKVNVYQRKSDFLRINFIISCQLIKKIRSCVNESRAYRVYILLDNVAISTYTRNESGWYVTFLPLKMYKWVFILIALQISSVTLLYKLQNATEKVVFRTNASSQKS